MKLEQTARLTPCLDSLTNGYMQRKRKSRKGGSHSTLSLLRKELQEGNLQSLFGGSSCLFTSNAAPDPLLSSFILPMADDYGSVQPHLSAEPNSMKCNSPDKSLERYVTDIFLLLHHNLSRKFFSAHGHAQDSISFVESSVEWNVISSRNEFLLLFSVVRHSFFFKSVAS